MRKIKPTAKLRYTARIGGHNWRLGPTAEFSTIRECREYAESYGETAEWCEITDANGRVVGSHMRTGSRWYRATV